ncbi:MAG TPA: transposase [Roseiflexaceae bacterium]|nr:transposase [Roseiflexaceae bacterium]
MPYDPNRHRRRSIRLRGYDYAQAGAYFVTICTNVRAPWFGMVSGGAVQLSAPGDMVAAWWREVTARFPPVDLDEYVVMPDHLHGIVLLRAEASQRVALGTVVQWFKTMTTNAYIRGVRERGWPPFEGRLWQRNYYERIIRDDEELAGVRRYIAENPAYWEARRSSQ